MQVTPASSTLLYLRSKSQLELGLCGGGDDGDGKGDGGGEGDDDDDGKGDGNGEGDDGDGAPPTRPLFLSLLSRSQLELNLYVWRENKPLTQPAASSAQLPNLPKKIGSTLNMNHIFLHYATKLVPYILTNNIGV